MTKQIYIVISQTGTILSRILKLVTKAEYNHASISLVPDLNTMYSFVSANRLKVPQWGDSLTKPPTTGL